MAKTQAPTIEGLWKGIDAWLKKNAPVAHGVLQEAAAKAALAKLEEQLGMALPSELASFLSIHDGQKADSGIAVVGNWDLLSCERIGAAHAALGKLYSTGVFKGRKGESKDGLVKPAWWNEKWIPFMESPLTAYFAEYLSDLKSEYYEVEKNGSLRLQ